MTNPETQHAVAASVDLPPYPTAEFLATVLACRPRTAVFDCDGTLWAPDSGVGFMRWTIDRQLVFPDRRIWIEERYKLYESGALHPHSDTAETIICGEMVQLYAGLQENAVRNAARVYVNAHVQPRIFPAMARLVDALRDAGTEIWAVSSTNNWVVEAGVGPVPSAFGILPDHVLAARVAVTKNGTITDQLLAVPTDQAKAEALIAAGLPHPDVVFGNSIHDAAMLAIARRAFPINPNAALAELAARRGWRCYMPDLPPARQNSTPTGVG